MDHGQDRPYDYLSVRAQRIFNVVVGVLITACVFFLASLFFRVPTPFH